MARKDISTSACNAHTAHLGGIVAYVPALGHLSWRQSGRGARRDYRQDQKAPTAAADSISLSLSLPLPLSFPLFARFSSSWAQAQNGLEALVTGWVSFPLGPTRATIREIFCITNLRDLRYET